MAVRLPGVISLDSRTRPVFGKLVWRRAQRHVLLADEHGFGIVGAFLADAPVPPGDLDIILTVAPDRLNMRAFSWPERTRCIAASDLEATLADVAGSLPAGTAFYVAGAETFIADVLRTASDLGFGHAAISTEANGPTLRHVQCVHCKTIYREVRHRAIHCDVCDFPIVVRDHFSSRLGAYQGVVLGVAPDIVAAKLEELL